MKKLLIALALLALLLAWGHSGAQQIETQVALSGELDEACCLPDGSCQDLSPSGCMVLGGYPGGPGSVCLGVEACAYPDGSCADMDAFCCLTQAGSPGGPGSVCLGVEACCYPDDSCGDHDAHSCLVMGGTPEGPGTNCATTVCGAAPPDLSIEVMTAGCTTAGGSTTCYVPVSTQFTVTMNVDVLPPSTGNYTAFQGYLTHTGGLTRNDRPLASEIVWPDGVTPLEASGAGWYKAADMTAVVPPYPLSTHIGAVMEVDYTCGASPSSETVTMVHGSSINTYLVDGNGQPAEEAGSEALIISCQVPPDLSIEGVGLGCNTVGGPTTCNVPVNTQFTVRMNVDVLPPSTGDYDIFQGYLDYSAGLTRNDRAGTSEIVWPDCELPVESPGAGYYRGSCLIYMSPPSTWTGAVMEVDYTCGASPGSQTVTMEHGFATNETYLRDGNGQPAAEAGSETLTINCQAAPPDEIKWVQLPYESDRGLDVGTLDPFLPVVLAEDFQCTESGLITRIDFWASWYHDELPMGDPNMVGFTLSLHSDVPAGADLPWSHPGELLWEYSFDPYECFVEPWAYGVLEGWFDPAAGYYEPSADSQIWLYICLIPEPYWFQQEVDTVYWLDIQPTPTEFVYFGWKTSFQHWNDDGVWALGAEPVDPLAWSELRYPPGHDFAGESIDLAFRLWGHECNPLLDSDGDTFYDDVECYLPTDFRDDCPDVLGSHDAWPIDMNMDRQINLGGDVVKYVGKMGGDVSVDPSLKRLDLNADGNINLGGDVVKYVGKMGAGCP